MVQVSDFYCDQNVLITGATGFIGKVLVEKLLRSCDVRKIYVLVRRKKNASVHERYIDYVNHFIFNEVRAKDEKFMDKIVFINGDMTVDGLGMSARDETTLIDEVNIIFHCAANVKFNDALKDAININAIGTLRMLKFAEKVKQLKVFSYMSTAFCQSYQEQLEERFYPTNLDIFGVIEKTKTLDDDRLINLEENLLSTTKHPNTYTLSKAIAEEIVCSFHKTLPIVILRPSLVWFAHTEPMPGYVEGMHSGMAIVCGGMTGLIRSMYVGKKSVSKQSPVDFVINATIVSAWKRAVTSAEDVPTYNCTDAEENPMLWNQSVKVIKESFEAFAPYDKIMWYPNLTFTSSYIWHVVSLLLFQIIPALIFDIFWVLSGRKATFLRLQRKIISNTSILYYFTTRNFQFKTNRLRKLFDELDDDDKVKFNFDHTSIVWKDYYEGGIRGIRKFLLREDETTLRSGKAQEKVRKLYYADVCVKAFCLATLVVYLIRFLSWFWA